MYFLVRNNQKRQIVFVVFLKFLYGMTRREAIFSCDAVVHIAFDVLSYWFGLANLKFSTSQNFQWATPSTLVIRGHLRFEILKRFMKNIKWKPDRFPNMISFTIWIILNPTLSGNNVDQVNNLFSMLWLGNGL